MQTLEDRLQITDLITGWMHRDLGEWDQLRSLFHPDGTIEITWFEGSFSDFVDGSMRMGASDFKTKHLIGVPVVTFNGNKAIVETNAMIVGENVRLDLGCNTHNRFYDRAEKRDGVWKLTHRQSIYDMATFTFPKGIVDIDPAEVARFPREYAALAYLLEKSGFPLKRIYATRGSELEKTMKSEAHAWLSSSSPQQ
ncbi:MAG: nuclear transport factor 2 family protein [Acidobacteriota bacterium]|nr:nuclear transport factor 2 family protein [Acidobacteriota bacterium]